jgi:spermidine synthase
VTTASVTLSPSGSTAAVAADPLHPGAFELLIDGVEQSHVDLGDPSALRHDYLARMAAVTEAFRPSGVPVRILHLGAGGLTLPRAVQATRPGSDQHVCDRDENLIPFVVEKLPLPPGTRLTTLVGDAAEVVRGLAGAPPFDLVVCDLYVGLSTPAHVRDSSFYAGVAALLAPAGLVLINVADDDGLPALREQLEVLRPVFGGLLLMAPAPVLTDARAGNVVIVASTTPHPPDLVARLAAAGPHPAAVADGHTSPRSETPHPAPPDHDRST